MDARPRGFIFDTTKVLTVLIIRTAIYQNRTRTNVVFLGKINDFVALLYRILHILFNFKKAYVPDLTIKFSESTQKLYLHTNLQIIIRSTVLSLGCDAPC